MVFSGFIQIAGACDLKEARRIEEAGADALGFPLRLPVHKEDLSEEAAGEIAALLSIPCVLITYLEKADEIAALAEKTRARLVQIHGSISLAELAALRLRLPGASVIKSLVVNPRSSVETLLDEGRRCAEHVDAFLTDTFDPETGASGATGRTHDWRISAELAERLSRPLILAGGLTPDNVAEAIRAVRPAGVDSHTGVEGADGRKRFELVSRFVKEARAAFAGLSRR